MYSHSGATSTCVIHFDLGPPLPLTSLCPWDYPKARNPICICIYIYVYIYIYILYLNVNFSILRSISHMYMQIIYLYEYTLTFITII